MGLGAAEHISDAISRACIDPSAWQDVTDGVLSTFPGTKVAVVGHDTTLACNVPGAFSGYDAAYGPSYEAYYSRIIPNLHRWTSLPLGRVAHVWEIMSEEELLRSEYYNDWLRPQEDARQAVVAVLQRDPGRQFLLTAQVEQRVVDHTMEPVMAAMRAAYPLMRHALEINRMMLGLRIDSAMLRLGLEPDGAAILLLSATGGILYANARAEALLAEGTLVRHDQVGRVDFQEGDASLRLAGALSSRSGSRAASFRSRGAVVVGGEAKARGVTYDVRLMRLAPDVLDRLQLSLLMHAPAPSHLLVLRPVARAADEVGVIARRLGLTRAEAEVALALDEGLTVAEIAAARAVSVHTVRSQVKEALGKTGHHRQADLIRAVERLKRNP